MAKKKTSLKGNLAFLTGNRESLSGNQIDLLRAIDQCGSITRAAKEVGISYKTAWDRINNMNNLSDKPLVLRSAGGVHGGGTRLTPLGLQVVKGFQDIQQEHETFVAQLGGRLNSLNDVARFIRSSDMKSSARNQFRGRIKHISRGSVNTEATVGISARNVIVVILTNNSSDTLDLKKNDEVIALIKASWVILTRNTRIKTSARNKLTGKVIEISHGEVNCEVVLALENGKTICALITRTSLTELGLKEGDTACAFFKASSVILMRD